MVYVTGNDYHQSRLIMERLGIDLSRTVALQDYSPQKDQIPILVSSGGIFHDDTLLLSHKLKEEGIPINVKVIIDRHADFNHEAKRQKGSGYCSHSLTVYKEGFLDELYILGIEEDSQIPQICKALGRNGGLDNIVNGIWSTTKLVYSANINKAREIRDKRIHVSIDIDAIPNLDCVGITWGGLSGPALGDVSEILRFLLENNHLIAFDVVGYYPQDLEGNTKTNTQGLVVYRKLIEQVNRTQ